MADKGQGKQNKKDKGKQQLRKESGADSFEQRGSDPGDEKTKDTTVSQDQILDVNKDDIGVISDVKRERPDVKQESQGNQGVHGGEVKSQSEGLQGLQKEGEKDRDQGQIRDGQREDVQQDRNQVKDKDRKRDVDRDRNQDRNRDRDQDKNRNPVRDEDRRDRDLDRDQDRKRDRDLDRDRNSWSKRKDDRDLNRRDDYRRDYDRDRDSRVSREFDREFQAYYGPRDPYGPVPDPYLNYVDHPMGTMGGYNYYDSHIGQSYARPMDRAFNVESQYDMEREREYQRKQREDRELRESRRREKDRQKDDQDYERKNSKRDEKRDERRDENRKSDKINESPRDKKYSDRPSRSEKDRDYDRSRDQVYDRDFGEYDLRRDQRDAEGRRYDRNREFDRYADADQSDIYQPISYEGGLYGHHPISPLHYSRPEFGIPGPYNLPPEQPAYHHLPYPKAQPNLPAQYMGPIGQGREQHGLFEKFHPNQLPRWLLSAIGIPRVDRAHAPILLHHGDMPVLVPAPKVALQLMRGAHQGGHPAHLAHPGNMGRAPYHPLEQPNSWGYADERHSLSDHQQELGFPRI